MALPDPGERKIGHDGSGMTQIVAVIEVIDARFVEVDGLLDPTQSEHVGEERVVADGVAGQ
jgi:hypothetical protein